MVNAVSATVAKAYKDMLGGNWHPIDEFARPDKVGQLACGCVVKFIDCEERRIAIAAGIPLFEVAIVRSCVNKNGRERVGEYGCQVTRNGRPRYAEYYVPMAYLVMDPKDALAAELGAKFG